MNSDIKICYNGYECNSEVEPDILTKCHVYHKKLPSGYELTYYMKKIDRLLTKRLCGWFEGRWFEDFDLEGWVTVVWYDMFLGTYIERNILYKKGESILERWWYDSGALYSITTKECKKFYLPNGTYISNRVGYFPYKEERYDENGRVTARIDFGFCKDSEMIMVVVNEYHLDDRIINHVVYPHSIADGSFNYDPITGKADYTKGSWYTHKVSIIENSNLIETYEL